MLTIVDWPRASLDTQNKCLQRVDSTEMVRSKVSEIIAKVREEGDRALLHYSRIWDAVKLSSLVIDKACIQQAEVGLDAFAAIETAIRTITVFHEAELPKPSLVRTAPGVTIERIYRPIERVGLYVPGGNNTPLISSLLMQAIPARIAGCPIRVLCTPPNAAGQIDPHLLVAANLCEIETIYPVGGAQAIAALAYGTESIMKVDKIFGPGNAFVTEAKSLVGCDPHGAAIDMPAGPSEVMIIADATASPSFVAADLLAQAEHGRDSQAILLCQSLSIAEAVNEALVRQMEHLSRAEIVRASLKNACIICAPSREEIITIVNRYAPEHLIINCLDAKDWVADIQHAGTLFLGPMAAESMGDYITGSNHVLPTNGYARSHSGLGIMDFLKSMSVQSITPEAIQALGPAAYTLAMIEGLDAHASAVKLRMQAEEVAYEA